LLGQALPNHVWDKQADTRGQLPLPQNTRKQSGGTSSAFDHVGQIRWWFVTIDSMKQTELLQPSVQLRRVQGHSLVLVAGRFLAASLARRVLTARIVRTRAVSNTVGG
jgi:hypothetical protein